MKSSETQLSLDTLNSTLDDATIAAADVTMSDLQLALVEPALLPEGWSAEAAGGPHWLVKRPDGDQYTVTTDLVSYEYAPGHVEWFGPVSPAFPN